MSKIIIYKGVAITIKNFGMDNFISLSVTENVRHKSGPLSAAISYSM